ncbi:ABC transporter permease [Clostridium folliculivorans]|uniref:ABC transporter permease n=1 Tax=Clostridium folliculivorans TaxID=2886038 RepID=A0A9W5Y4U4_9CLOT|nr:ABC transporter permease [Clostridium folliculivorans]GKU26681.1 hypothetical protein CFOLD11_35080 [Clostridium folliculivorans]GKU28887.1 hypothetical protein CFB3_09930 [Clostridium folliculivorans]
MLRAELYKYLKNHLIWITFLVPIAWVFSMIYLVPSLKLVDDANAGLVLYVVSYNMFSAIVVPTYIILICRIVGEMEERNNNWRLLLCMPVKKYRIYLVKLFMLMAMLLILYSGYLTGMLISGGIFSDFQLPLMKILSDLVISFLCTFSILSFFYIFSLEKISIIAYLGVGIVILLSGFLVMQSENIWTYFPWCYPTVVPMISSFGRIIKFIGINLVITIVIHLMGCIRFCKKEWDI